MVIPSLRTLILVLLAVVFAEWVRRIFWMNRFGRNNPPLVPSASPVPLGRLSIIVPARDEEKNIGNCLASLLKQDHPDYEILVVDDRSSDRTPHLLENFKKLANVPFKVIRIEKLPPGWTGKNHAMAAASKAASGDWLLYTDADTTHRPHSARTAVETALARGADLLTLAPEVECRSFWENTVQPLAVSSLALWFNTTEINTPRSKKVLANGQFILIKKDIYERAGGNEAIKSEVVEDVELAKNVKAAGGRVLFLNGTRLYSTRMYTSLAQIFKGWTRIFIHLFERRVGPILHKVFLFLFFSLSPFIVLTWQKLLWFSRSGAFDPALFWASALVCGFIVALRFEGNRLLRANPWYAFLHPVGSVVMAWLLLVCVGRIATGGRSEWRGERY